MRLWHQDLISCLPRQQLLGQHRECCALRGKGWNRRHSTVDYVFEYRLERLVAFHKKVMAEMKVRGYNVTEKWEDVQYRGKKLGYDRSLDRTLSEEIVKDCTIIYPEHDSEYLQECQLNLLKKGVACFYVEENIL
ncbi:MAG: TIGR02328 family protein [Halanaerobiaceae bacterium]